VAREWKKSREVLPPGCLGAWHATESGRTWAGIFQVGAESFLACWHPIGQRRPVVVRNLPSFSAAQDVVSEALATTLVVPRNMLPLDF